MKMATPTTKAAIAKIIAPCKCRVIGWDDVREIRHCHVLGVLPARSIRRTPPCSPSQALPTARAGRPTWC